MTWRVSSTAQRSGDSADRTASSGGSVVDRVEDPGEEELRQQDEREDLVCLALGAEIGEDEQPERAAIDGDEEQDRDERHEDERRQRHARDDRR